MKKIVYNLLMFSVAIGFSGCCSTLKVNVDIFDLNEYKKSEEYRVLETENLVKHMSIVLSENYEDELSSDIYNLLKKDFEDRWINSKIAVFSDETSENEFYSTIYKSVAEEVSRYIEQLKGIHYKIRDGNEDLNILTNDYKVARYELNDNVQMVYKEIVSGSPFDESLLKDAKLTDPISEQIKDVDYAFGISIINDPMASMIVKAPEHCWRKYKKNLNTRNIDDEAEPKDLKRNRRARINKTVVRTYFGNSDVAVKMDAPGNYIVKGARVDSDEALKASFKVLNQGIKYLAYSSGVPMGTDNSDGNNGEVSMQLPELANGERLKKQLSVIETNSKNYTDAFVRSIALELVNLDNNPGDTECINRINNAFEAYKALIPSNNPNN